ncbi:MAG: spermidine synthase [Oxalobacteraceae bacterium]|jgi:spermidine synthase|nr:spermidine synthase [Oxalobacteraceae bacterium]
MKPSPTHKKRAPKFEPITLSEQDGVRYLHFGTEWVQGAMRIRRPYSIELEYAQQMMAWMLFIEQPQHIVQLGLGTGALTKFCYREYPEAQITAVELNPNVIEVCRSMFRLPANDDRLNVIQQDADLFVNDLLHRRRLDVLQIDLYDATARGPVLDTPEFYRACAQCLRRTGIATINLFGDHPSFSKNIAAIHTAFDHVLALPEVHQGNVVVIAFKSAPSFDFANLYQRATTIRVTTKLPAHAWVNDIKTVLETG